VRPVATDVAQSNAPVAGVVIPTVAPAAAETKQ
jgi:hypothetical protein